MRSLLGREGNNRGERDTCVMKAEGGLLGRAAAKLGDGRQQRGNKEENVMMYMHEYVTTKSSSLLKRKLNFK